MSNTHLAIVSNRIGEAVVEFCNINTGKQFHADDLRAHVTNRCGYVAPGSSDRILRDLRQKGEINYILISRPKSLYKVI